MKFFKKTVSILMVAAMLFPNMTATYATTKKTQDTTDTTVEESVSNEYSVSAETVENGQIYINDQKDTTVTLEAGEAVTVSLKADSGYDVATFYIKDADTGDIIASKETDDDIFKFTMPEMDIVVGGTFSQHNNTSEEKSDTQGESAITKEDVADLDFSSCELLIATEDDSILTENTEVVSSYNGIYLTRFQDTESTRDAYCYYYDKADMVEINSKIEADEKDVNNTSTDAESDKNENDALTNLNEMIDEVSESVDEDSEIEYYSGAVALIDTGSCESQNIIKAVSMIGESVEDDNGHATKLVNSMTEVNPNVKVVSIKALNQDAEASISDVYAAIYYAIEQKVSVINLSMSSIATNDSEILKQAIGDAVAHNIIVVASAGNKGKNAKYYIPANIDSTITIGACDSDGNKLDISNYGECVDLYVVADSTSEAAAKYSAYSTLDISSMTTKDKLIYTKLEVEEGISDNNKDEDGVQNGIVYFDDNPLVTNVIYADNESNYLKGDAITAASFPDSLVIHGVITDWELGNPTTFSAEIDSISGVPSNCKITSTWFRCCTKGASPPIGGEFYIAVYKDSSSFDSSDNSIEYWYSEPVWSTYAGNGQAIGAMVTLQMEETSEKTWVTMKKGVADEDYIVTAPSYDGLQYKLRVGTSDDPSKAANYNVMTLDVELNKQGRIKKVLKDNKESGSSYRTKKMKGKSGEEDYLHIGFDADSDKTYYVTIWELKGDKIPNEDSYYAQGNKAWEWNEYNSGSASSYKLTKGQVNILSYKKVDELEDYPHLKPYATIAVNKSIDDVNSANQNLRGAVYAVFTNENDAKSATLDNYKSKSSLVSCYDANDESYIYEITTNDKGYGSLAVDLDVYDAGTFYVKELKVPNDTSLHCKLDPTVHSVELSEPYYEYYSTETWKYDDNQDGTIQSGEIRKNRNVDWTPVFDWKYYVWKNGLSITKAKDAFLHFYEVGIEQGYQASPTFNLSEYKTWLQSNHPTVYKKLSASGQSNIDWYLQYCLHGFYRGYKGRINQITDDEYAHTGSEGFITLGLVKSVEPTDKFFNFNVTKKSSNTTCTNGNPNYNFNGIEYSLYNGNKTTGTPIATFTLNNDGTVKTVNGSNTTKYQVSTNDYLTISEDGKSATGTFTMKESKTNKVYKLNPNSQTKSITVDKTNNNGTYTFEFADEPIMDAFDLTLEKNMTGVTDTTSIPSLAGAEFTVKFYPELLSSNLTTSALIGKTPQWTGVFKTMQNGAKCTFTVDDTHKISESGTAVYNKKPDGSYAFPLGYITIQETKAPTGYKLDGSEIIIKDASGAKIDSIERNNSNNGIFSFKISDDGNVYYNTTVTNKVAKSIEVHENPKMFGFTMTKLDADLKKNELQGDTKNLTATFEIHNNDTKSLWIDKNYNGKVENGEMIAAGVSTTVTFTTDVEGKFKTQNNQYLQVGKWEIVETKGPEGYLVSSTRNGNPSHEIDGTNLADNSLYDVNANNGVKAIKDPVKRGGFAIVKVDADREAKDDLTVESKPQGDAELEAEFEIINNSDHKVVVPYDGTTYDIGATILTFKTTKKQINGHYYYEYHTDDINLLPYGTYIIREKTAGTGYFKDATDAAGSGRESQAKSEFEFTISEESQYHIIGNTEGTNDVNETQKSGSDYVTDIKAITDADTYELHSENAFVNVVKRGKAVIKKNDGDRWTHYSDKQNTFESRLGQGDAILENATYDIINSSKYSVLIDKDNDGKYETEVQPGEVVYTLTTDATGYAETPDDFLPYGTYTIKETKAPKGYNLVNKHGITANVTAANATISNPDDKTLTVSQITDKIDDENDVINCEYKHTDKTKINDTNYNHTFYNDVIRAGIRMKKNDADRKDHLSSKQGDYFLTKDYESRKEQGDASLDGAVYQIINQSKSYVWVDTNNNGTFEDTEIYQPGDVVYEMTTHYDETYGHGYASTPNNTFLPYGTYDIVEKTPSEGYLNSTIRGGVTKRTVVVTEEGTWYDLMYHAYDASLSDEENSAQATSDIDHTFFEPIMRAGFKFDKRDEETGKNEPLGSANLEGTYKVVNLSASYVWVDVGNGKDNDGDGQIDHYGNPDGIYSDDEIFWPGEVIYTFKTDKHDGHYETPNNQYLPYGTYKIQEIDPPMGYLMLSDKNPSLSLTFEVREEDKQYDLTQKIYNYAVRGDLWFNKRDGNTSKVMAYIPFKITSLDQDGNEIESHIVYTDKNGYFNSASSYVRHGWKTNAGDQGYADYMAYYEEHGTWPEDDGVVIEGTQGHSGTWFGVDTKPVQVDESYQDYIDAFNQNKEYPNDGSLDIKDSIRLEQTGAFPYGTYLIEELPCKSNEGFVMYKDSFVIDFESASDKTTEMDPHGWYAGRDSGCFDYGNIDNFDVPTIETIALAQDTESHMTPAYKDLVIIDDVSLHHLVKDTDYTLKTTLWTADDAVPEQLKDENGEPIIVEKKIHPTSQEHFAKVNIEFDATPYKGKTIVVFEELYDAEGNLVASHTDVTDKEQQIGISGIETELSQNGKHLVKAEKNVTLVDKIKYMNLEPEKTVKLTDYLIDKDTLDYALDDNGNKIKAETTFKVDESGFGEVEVEFTFDAETLEGKTLVAFAEVTNNRKNNPTYYADHMDIEDAAQTIKFPKLGTTAFDEETGVQMSFADDHITVVDTCAYSNVFENSKLIIKGKLVNKETGNVITVDGKEVTAETEVFTSTGESGTADVTFEFDGTGLEGTTLVAYETLYIVEPDETEGAEEGATVEREIADHSNPNDAAETIYVPQVKTTAISDDTQLNVAYAGNNVNLTDKVECKNIIPELDYTLEGVLMDQTTGTEIKDANGNAITATLDFKATSADDIQNMPFTFDASSMKGKSVVVFETLYLNKKTTDESGKETVTKVLVAEHKDINDEGQTIHFPEIGTNAFDAESHLHITKAGKATIIDTVDYHNLVPGIESTIKGQLVNQETNEILTDAEGNPITAEAVFTPDKADGKADVKFEFDASNLSGTAYVGFEELYVNGNLIADHKDIDDKAQTFYIPKIGTTLTNGSNNIHMALADSKVTLNDTISYESVLPSQKFVMKGWLVDKSTGERVPLTEKTDITIDTHTTTDAIEEPTETDAHTSGDAVPVDREENVAYVTFTAETKDGTVVVPFTFNTTGMEGKSVVAYEELYAVDEDGREWLVAEHKDINDEGQTIHIPKIRTTAINKETSTHYAGAGKVVITDTVKFDNIIPNIEYTLVGKLMNQETNKPVKRGDGSEVMAQATFTPETASGETTIEFTFYTDNEIGNSLVAFEEVYVGTDLVGQHKDINDESQTIHVVEIKTSMIDSKTNIKTTADGKTVLVDTVSYKGLIPGVPFVMSGKLMDKATGAALTKGGNGADIKTLINGITGKSNEYISEVAFTPEKSEGTVELSFEIDTSDLDGKTIVAYEKLYSEDKEIAKHEDINDLDQSVYVVKIGTTASSKDDKDELEAAKDTVLKDVIAFENLTKDTDYTIKGEIYDKSTGKSTGIKAESKFTPKDSKGETTMNFTIDTTKYAGKELVVFEYIYYKDVLVASHTDINSKSQTVTVKKPKDETTTEEKTTEQKTTETPKTPSTPNTDTSTKTNDIILVYIILGIIIVSAGGVAVYYGFKRRKIK